MDDPSTLVLTLFGSASLRPRDASPARLERKAAGLLSYLCVQGETARGRLAGLLWPEVPEATARNNLSQTLARLRTTAEGAALVEGRDRLRLAGWVEGDILAFQRALKNDDPAAVASLTGELLAGFTYEDCPDFEAWLGRERDRMEARRQEALAALADAAEQEGDLRGALVYARRLLETDPWSETNHRRLIRILWLAGDSSAALNAYDRCRAFLFRELGTLPGPDTLNLVRAIERETVPPGNSCPPPRLLPPVLLRPPVLIERGDILARMQVAWESGRAILVSGAPGIGKTRLMQEFLGASGRVCVFLARPEDRAAPYATLSRYLRDLLGFFPGLKLPDWVHYEISRLLPVVCVSPEPLTPQTDKLRLYQALAEATRLAVRSGMHGAAFDDLHLADPASVEALSFLHGYIARRQDRLRMVICFRPAQLTSHAKGSLRAVTDRGDGVQIDLPPLTERGVKELLAHIDPPLEPRAAAFFRHAGGNPLFILETLRALFDAGALGPSPPECLPVAAKVGQLIRDQLTRLSPQAIAFARVAAVAGDRFTPAVATRLLAIPLTQLIVLWGELEAAGVIIGSSMACGLLAEVLRQGIPDSLRVHLKEQIAAVQSEDVRISDKDCHAAVTPPS